MPPAARSRAPLPFPHPALARPRSPRTTWARYFSRVDQVKVLRYANEVVSRGLPVRVCRVARARASPLAAVSRVLPPLHTHTRDVPSTGD